jgi:CDP-6-deoxy-D-xylo-4-hexulose-3-dehydrase
MSEKEQAREQILSLVSVYANKYRIMEDSFWIGVYPGMTDEMLGFMAEMLIER